MKIEKEFLQKRKKKNTNKYCSFRDFRKFPFV